MPYPEPTISLLDSFSGASEGPPPNSSWTTGWLQHSDPRGLWTDGVGFARAITTNQINGAYYNTIAASPNCELVSDILVGSSTSFMYLGVRLNNIGVGTTDGYMLEVERDDITTDWFHRLYRLDNDVATQIATTDTPNLNTSATPIGIRIIGSKIIGYATPPGSSTSRILLEAEDSTYTDAGYYGIAIKGSLSTVRMDNVYAGLVTYATTFASVMQPQRF